MTSQNSNPVALTMTVLMTPDLVNFSGKVHGGAILRLLDQVAYACASRYCGQYVVTQSVDQVVFKQPILVGELVTFLARVNYTGRTSLEVGIKVVAEDPRAKTSRSTLTCFITMVAVDAHGAAVEVDPIPLNTEEDKRRWEMAHLRRQLREDVQIKHEVIHAKYAAFIAKNKVDAGGD